MFGNYDFETDDKLLLYLKITSSFFPHVFFKIYQNENNDFIVYWRKELDDNEYFNKFTDEFGDKLKYIENLEELYKTSEYKAFMNKYSPVNKVLLNNCQKMIVTNLIEIKSTAIPPALDGGLRLTRNVKSSIL